MSLDRQGRDVFGALFSYDEFGQPSWRVLQARLQGGIVATELMGFVDGNCLVCGDSWVAPRMLEDKIPLHLVFGLFEDGDEMPSHTLSCSQDQTSAYRVCGFATELGEPGPPVYQVPWDDIGTDFIEVKGLSTRYIRLPGPD